MTDLQVNSEAVFSGLFATPDIAPRSELVVTGYRHLRHGFEVTDSEKSSPRPVLDVPQDGTDLDLNFKVRRTLAKAELLHSHIPQHALRRRTAQIGVHDLKNEIHARRFVERQRRRINLLPKHSHDRSMPNESR